MAFSLRAVVLSSSTAAPLRGTNIIASYGMSACGENRLEIDISFTRSTGKCVIIEFEEEGENTNGGGGLKVPTTCISA
jgi:hypothetical protein